MVSSIQLVRPIPSPEFQEVRHLATSDRYYLDMEVNDKSHIEFTISDYAQISSFQNWLGSTPGVQVLRRASSPDTGEMGTLDVLTAVAGSSGLVTLIRVIPEFLRSRRSGLSVTATVKGEKFTMTTTNVKDVLPILERLLND